MFGLPQFSANEVSFNFLVLLALISIFLVPIFSRTFGLRWALGTMLGMLVSFPLFGPEVALAIAVLALGKALGMRGAWLFLVTIACALILHMAVRYATNVFEIVVSIGAVAVVLLWGWTSSARDTVDDPETQFSERQGRREQQHQQETDARERFDQAWFGPD